MLNSQFLGEYSILSRVWGIISKLSQSRSSTTFIRIRESSGSTLLFFIIGVWSLAKTKNKRIMRIETYSPPTVYVIPITPYEVICLSGYDDDTDTGGTGSNMPWG